MKQLFMTFGALIVLHGYLFCQEPEFVAKKDFQLEKARLQEAIYKLNKSNQELKQQILFQAETSDSLAELLTLQSEALTIQQDALGMLQSSQTSFDDRLLTQRKSGTLIAILIPACLFLFTLVVLIWLIIFRHRTNAFAEELNERFKELSKRMDEQIATFELEHSSIRSELHTSANNAELHIQRLSSETQGKLDQLEKMIKEIQATHETMHQESHLEYEAFKSTLQKSYESFSHDLTKLRGELSDTTKDFTARLKEIIKPKPGRS